MNEFTTPHKFITDQVFPKTPVGDPAVAVGKKYLTCVDSGCIRWIADRRLEKLKYKLDNCSDGEMYEMYSSKQSIFGLPI